MSLLQNLPSLQADARLSHIQSLREDALDKWVPELRASADNADNVVTMYGTIGATYDGEGVTAKRIGAALRAIGERDIVVNLNSPGGDFFEGVTIYNMLRAHKGKVTVNVMGLAASSGSIIAMAGDEINIGLGAHIMIHNSWVLAAGNRNDLREVADYLEPFDRAMAQVYAARTGLSESKITAMMDEETFIGQERALKEGFATGTLDADAVVTETKASNRKALALVESAMAKAGYSRSARRDALHALFTDTPGAVGDDATPCAGDDVAASLQNLLNTLKG